MTYADQTMFASIVIPTYKREQQLVDTITYVLADAYPSFEVIVVDQTGEHTPEVAAALEDFQQDSRFRYVQLPMANLPLARNVGLRLARGEVLIYVDDDVELADDFIAAHVARYTDEEVGAVAGRIITPGVGAARDATEGETANRPLPGRLSPDGNNESHFNQTKYDGVVEWGQGCNMSFRKQALEAIGGFDERFVQTAIHEEVDVFCRLRESGWRAVFEPWACLVHLKEASGGCRHQEQKVSRMESTYRNKSLFFFKNEGWGGWLRYSAHQFRAAYSAIRIQGWSWRVGRQLLKSHLRGVVVHYRDRSDRLSKQLAHRSRDVSMRSEPTKESMPSEEIAEA